MSTSVDENTFPDANILKVLPYRLQKLSHFPCCHHECLIDWRQAITPCIQAWLEDFFSNGQKSWLTFNLRSTNICSCSKARLKGTCLPNFFFHPKGLRLVCLLCLGSFLYSLQKRTSKVATLKRTAACQLATGGERQKRTREDSEVTTNSAHNPKNTSKDNFPWSHPTWFFWGMVK